MSIKLKQPTDPYDTAAWMAFYDQNPGFRRSVGAEGVNEDDKSGENTDDKSGEKSDDKPGEKSEVSDAEAKLLKEAMKHKAAAKEAAAKLAAFKDIDVDEYKALKAAKEEAAAAEEEAEQKRLIEKGQFESVKKQIIEAADEKLKAALDESSAKDETIAKLQDQIGELTIGSSFNSSTFLKEKTVLPPSKARALYGGHFDLDESGKTVPYDKPKGAADRAPLVDGSGNPLAFDAAIAKIIDMDSDREQLMRTSLKPGSDSKPGTAKLDTNKKPLTSSEKISAGVKGLADMKVSTLDL